MPKPREYRSHHLLGPDSHRAAYTPPAPPGSLYTHIDRWTHRPSRLRDNIVRAGLILYWLLMAALLSPPGWPLPLILFCWGLVTAATVVLWRGYRRLTRPVPASSAPPAVAGFVPEKYRVADDLTRHIEDVVAAGEQEAIDHGPKPPTRPLTPQERWIRLQVGR
jgi:hypothetical protein